MPAVAMILDPTAATPASRFGLVDQAGHPYRSLTFATERAARLYLDRQPTAFKRMLATAGYKVGPVESRGLHGVNTPDPKGLHTAEAPGSTRRVYPPAKGIAPMSTLGGPKGVQIQDAPADVCRLVLTIRGVEYRVAGIPAAAFGATARAYRLRKVGSAETHHVAETVHGATCDCPDQTFRHEGRDALGCKHIRALRALGLIR